MNFEHVILVVNGVTVLLGVLLLLGCARATYANNRTYAQRLAIIDSWEFLEGEAYRAALESFRSVAYADHKREVFWGRDPYRLYPHLQGEK